MILEVVAGVMAWEETIASSWDCLESSGTSVDLVDAIMDLEVSTASSRVWTDASDTSRASVVWVDTLSSDGGSVKTSEDWVDASESEGGSVKTSEDWVEAFISVGGSVKTSEDWVEAFISVGGSVKTSEE